MHNGTVQQPLTTVSCRHFTLLQTASNDTSGHRMMRNRLNLLCFVVESIVHNPPASTGSCATRMLRLASSVCRFLLHPAITDLHPSCLVSSNILINLCEG
ncbi:hypothetical protein TNCV_2835381 [Trichonephila clavipes]|uniref:Uncharacterized protein n=1 Tax=Trichonephila clavipes TaxID=2585209 RepID=A0A8X6RTY9_TRICX|nr:hypothetical protein TNCV_2835381 [Trichonephila clavipes]